MSQTAFTCTTQKPAYLVKDTDAIEKRCKRCNHLLLLDYGRRAEIVYEQIVVHIITSDYHGRCITCLSWFDWHPKKRKS